MRTITVNILALCCFATVAPGTGKGAKAIFVDTTTGSTIQSSAQKTRTAPPTRATAQATGGTHKPAASTPEVSGLMYYVELVSKSGETRRVTTDRTFTSGERILLHVVSSIDGDIAIYQKAANGQAVRLFPDRRIRGGNARIAKGVDTILPSPDSWFRFDNQRGTEELTIVLTPRTVAGTGGEPPASIQTASSRYDEVGPIAGSKGLVVETDREGPEQATYVVRRALSDQPPEPIVVAIRLKHQ